MSALRLLFSSEGLPSTGRLAIASSVVYYCQNLYALDLKPHRAFSGLRLAQYVLSLDLHAAGDGFMLSEMGRLPLCHPVKKTGCKTLTTPA